MMRNPAFLAILLLLAGCSSSDSGLLGDIHWHADIKVYLNGEQLNLSHERYMSTEEHTLSNFAHLHDGNGNIVHKHASGITLGFFFQTLGIGLNSSCLTLDNGTNYCTNEAETLKFYVNGKQNSQFDSYDFKDEDRILITYGRDSEQIIKSQMDSVTEEACIYSLTCPERGSPPDEASCVGDCKAEGG